MLKGFKTCAIAVACLYGMSGQSHAFNFGSIFHHVASEVGHKMSGGSHGGSHSGSHSGSEGGKVTPQSVFKRLMEGAKDVCGKGDFFGGKITIRSGNGIACNNKIVAAVATLKCGNRDDFAPSHCGKNARKVLVDKDGNPITDNAAIKQVLIEEAKKSGGMALTAIKHFGLSIKDKVTGHKAKPIAHEEEEPMDEMSSEEVMTEDSETADTSSSDDEASEPAMDESDSDDEGTSENDEEYMSKDEDEESMGDDEGTAMKHKSHSKKSAHHKAKHHEKHSKKHGHHKTHDEGDESFDPNMSDHSKHKKKAKGKHHGEKEKSEKHKHHEKKDKKHKKKKHSSTD